MRVGLWAHPKGTKSQPGCPTQAQQLPDSVQQHWGLGRGLSFRTEQQLSSFARQQAAFGCVFISRGGGRLA